MHCNDDVGTLIGKEVTQGSSLGIYMGRSGFIGKGVDRILHIEVRRNGIVQPSASFLP
jgi:hypothetical protein